MGNPIPLSQEPAELAEVEPPLHATIEEVVLPPPPEGPTWTEKIRRALVGKPRNLHDTSLFHRISLIPFLAWSGWARQVVVSVRSRGGVQDPGPAQLPGVASALMTGLTVFIIGRVSRDIEAF
jgi:hypothetical protein